MAGGRCGDCGAERADLRTDPADGGAYCAACWRRWYGGDTPSPAAGEELRMDGGCGPFSRAEFVAHYGKPLCWDRAVPAALHPGAAVARRGGAPARPRLVAR
eukprot:gene33204-2347_t